MKDKREDKRHQIITELEVQEGKDKIDAISSDISRGGLQFVCRKKFPVKSTLYIFIIKTRSIKPLECKVLWAKPAPHSPLFIIGGIFTNKIPEMDFYSILHICKG